MFFWIVLPLLGYAAYAIATSSSSANTGGTWPPSAAVTAALQTQISALVADVTGQQPTTAQTSNITNMLAAAPAQYAASLAASGQTPTIAGYQTWVLSGAYQAAAGSTNTGPGRGGRDAGGGVQTGVAFRPQYGDYGPTWDGPGRGY